MRRSSTKILLVELFTASRLLAGLIFAFIAFQRVPRTVLVGLYGFAIGTDLVDGFIARRFSAETYFGKVLDLISDKSITIISVLYAGARGIDLLPLALIASREIISIGARSIVVRGAPMLPSSRLLGGFMALMVWGNTMLLILANPKTELESAVNLIYWVAGIFFAVMLAARIYSNTHRIKAVLTGDRVREKGQDS